MTVGWNGTAAQLQQAAVGIAQQFAAAAAGAVALETFVAGVTAAGAPGLAPYGLDSTDATAFQALLAVLAQYAGLFYGQQALAAPVDFAQELAQLVGPPVPGAVANVAAQSLANSGLT